MNKALFLVLLTGSISIANLSCNGDKTVTKDTENVEVKESDTSTSSIHKKRSRLRLSINGDTVTQELISYTENEVLHKLVYSKKTNTIYLDSGEYVEAIIEKTNDTVYNFVVVSSKFPGLGKVISLIGRKFSEDKIKAIVLESIVSDTTINIIKYNFDKKILKQFDDFIICSTFSDKLSIKNKKHNVNKQGCAELGPFWKLKRGDRISK